MLKINFLFVFHFEEPLFKNTATESKNIQNS